jgi:hypothetical protein
LAQHLPLVGHRPQCAVLLLRTAHVLDYHWMYHSKKMQLSRRQSSKPECHKWKPAKLQLLFFLNTNTITN